MDTNKPLSETLEIVEPVANSETDYHAYFQSQSPEWRQAEQRKLLRKIDLRLLPILILCYLLNFLDRSNLAQARQGSLEKDLGMTGSDFNLATSIFFVGYLIMQLPSNMILTRVRPSLYLGCACVLWGVVSTCNAATHTFISLVLTRFFLGFVEAPFFPGAIFLMSSWYTREELTRRIPWFYSGNALANMFGGVIAAAILGNMDGASGIAGWRWLFIIVRSTFLHLKTLSGFNADNMVRKEYLRSLLGFWLRFCCLTTPIPPAGSTTMKRPLQCGACWRISTSPMSNMPAPYGLVSSSLSKIIASTFLSSSSILLCSPKLSNTSSRALSRLWVMTTLRLCGLQFRPG